MRFCYHFTFIFFAIACNNAHLPDAAIQCGDSVNCVACRSEWGKCALANARQQRWRGPTGGSRGCRHPGGTKPRDHGIERAPARTIWSSTLTLQLPFSRLPTYPNFLTDLQWSSREFREPQRPHLFSLKEP